MKLLTTLIFTGVLQFLFGQEILETKTYDIGKTIAFESKILNEKRILNVYLPLAYSSDDTTKYNVMYVLDGSAHEDFLHVVGLVQFFNLQMKMPKTIVVGIENVDRKRDFTFPTELKELKDNYPTTGHSENFIAALEQEIIPLIEKKYSCSNRRFLIGQSLGGLLSSEVLFKKPQLFSDYIIVSPSLWWDNESMFKQRNELLQAAKNEKVTLFVAVGKEGRIMEREAKGLYKSLLKIKQKGKEVQFHYFPRENHASVLHTAIYEALKWHFPYQE